MNVAELGYCLTAVVSSSVSQLCIKGASMSPSRVRTLGLLGSGSALLCCSVLLVVLALRSMPLSQLVSFAAMAYVLVPLGSRMVFGERLTPRFWLGVLCIVCGIVWAHL